MTIFPNKLFLKLYLKETGLFVHVNIMDHLYKDITLIQIYFDIALLYIYA